MVTMTSLYDDALLTYTEPYDELGYPEDYRVCEQRGGWVHLTVKPIVYTLGIVGILLTVVVLSKKTMCTSTNSYLTALAAADLMVLVILAVNIVTEHVMSCSREHEDGVFAFFHITTIFLNIALFASVWITVVLAVERYIAICHPMQAMSICTTKRARIMIGLIFLAGCVVRAPNLLDMEMVDRLIVDPHRNTTVTKRVLEWRQDVYNNALYSMLVAGLLAGLLPLLALAILNIRLVVEIRKSTRYLRVHLAANSRIHSIISHEETKITLMLIFIIFAFFVCQCPYMVFTAIVAFNNYYMHLVPHVQLVHDIALIVLAGKSACNFILYCWFSEKFWNTFKQIFCLRHCLPEQPLFHNGHNGCPRGSSHSQASQRTSCFITRETTC
ncbi:neuromedin-U receptor 1-like [Babylonia areolata]|uniref:neuromedin-U receptor 1-like n=1 Tax=Babylonia areolata TaxID=304850 RepID=UPI003FD5DD5F